MRNSHYSPFLLLETPGFSELLWAPTPGPPLRLCPGDLTAPPDLQLARAMTFACRYDIIINPTNFWWWWFEEGGGVHEIFTNREGGSTIFLLFPGGINNFSAVSRGGIKNLTESFIPFLPHPPPRELKNDNSLNKLSFSGYQLSFCISQQKTFPPLHTNNTAILRSKDILYFAYLLKSSTHNNPT